MTHVEKRQSRPGKEAIHSGHFMVSQFEAEDQDDFDDLAIPVPDEEQNAPKESAVATYTLPTTSEIFQHSDKEDSKQHQQLSIEISLTKLFKCMTLAYRQKLTSPKWNRFKGIKLRWKDKIRLNNVIWRCWHMQFIKKQNTLVCQFASPLDVDTHVKPETTILEGKYWKRRAEAVIAEYKKWRMFHIMRLFGKGDTSVQDSMSKLCGFQMSDMDTVESQCSDFAANMLTDEDYLTFMSDTLFSTITNHQPFAFPDCREIARGASLADFIQPSLGPLQPNLDDLMDTLEPFQDLLSSSRLPPVPEETTISTEDPLYRSGMSVDSYNPQNYIADNQNTTVAMPTSQMTIHGTNSNTQMIPMSEPVKNDQLRVYNGRLFAPSELSNNILGTQEMMPSFPQNTYEQQNATHAEQMHGNVYANKSPRVQYVNTQTKILPQQDTCYPKYNSALPPSQTAPETVSLLQQPVQNSKYASTLVIQGRSGYGREKPRSRLSHYSGQVANNHYQGYSQPLQNPVHVAPQNYEVRPSVRHSPPQMQYLQPNPVDFKAKSSPNSVNTRSFKLPSPPLVPVTSQQVQVAVGVNVVSGLSAASAKSARNKEQYRSHSLPLGAQLGADWVVSAPAHTHTPSHTHTHAHAHAHSLDASSTHASRAREVTPGAIRIRSRSSSSGVSADGASGGVGGGGGGGSGGGATRRPPPLTSVASEPTLPQASVMLAQLLSAQHSQSLYKLNNSAEEGVGVSDPTKSPILRGQPSPIGSDIISPHHSRAQSLSPPGSPSSERAGSPRESREARRTHLHAEQKRRYNIKNGFDTLQALIPHLNTNPAAKISKAAMLQKGAEYIKQLKAERNQIKEEMESLRQQIECLNNSISNCHSLLPATGAPVSRGRAGRLREMFAAHVAARTAHNWKYWLFSVVSAALVESFSACVSCSSAADLVRTTLLWAEQHCSLVEMRPAVLNSLRVLCTTTDILTSPERLADEARAAAAAAGVKREPT
ncbi:carbohydrate-responsive element-binding protein isoform X1 [Vanessa cardui]|uniref:carbohydrate-responsive element-binding protein isoform X1 n=2 Tax=Vanessa cardui TaxID=171605 RepID=UPI001F12CA45|nr:carbohydrate-responsive element-binding protein isoform X1 [Vanessa cardui]